MRSLPQVLWSIQAFVHLFPPPSLAARFLSQNVLPEGISSGCATALTADVACSHAVPALQAGTFYPESQLEVICTSTCDAALATYHNGILTECAADTWLGIEDVEQPIALISELIRYNYNFSCISDGTRFCNNVAAAYAVYLDPVTAALPGGLPAGGDYGGYTITDPCDICLIKNLRFQAESPYSLGPDLRSASAYESRTSSCAITGAPLTTTPSTFTPTTNTPTTPTCAGTTYTIQPGDTCNSISASEGIGTDWLITDNGLTAHCHDFPTTGTLCLANTCDVYTVLVGDTCKSIAKDHDISEAQLRAWNPSINAGCYNLESMIGDQLCVNKPGTPYTTPPLTTIQPTIPTTAAPVPTDIAVDTTEYCGKYYKVVLGDYCNLLTIKFGISLADFIFLNPAINENCTNLFAEESYCVQAVGDINTYTGRPGHVTFTLTHTTGGLAEDLATLLPPVAWSSPTLTTTAVPLASGVRTDCENFIYGSQFQVNLTGTSFISNCDLAAQVMEVTLEDLAVWNPSLGNTTSELCEFETGKRYCGKWYAGDSPPRTPLTGSHLPVREGMTESCIQTADVYDIGPTCENILDLFEISIGQFYEWNPSVGVDCSGLWAGYQYCVAVPTPASSSAPPPSSSTTPTPTPPGPTQAGQPPNCIAWHVAESGDDCGTVETEYSITHTQFIEWNPAVSNDCLSGFWGGYAYCVAISATPSSSTSSAAPTNTPIPPPSPNQPGNAIPSCNAYGEAQSGDWYDSTLRFRLLTTTLATKTPYVALSYVWGEPEPPVQILVDDRSFSITPNPPPLLPELHDEGLPLWAYMVCINQSDEIEKLAQIKQMSQIYGNSIRIIAFLDALEAGFLQHGEEDRVLWLDPDLPAAKVRARLNQLAKAQRGGPSTLPKTSISAKACLSKRP
ncbi:hypothetical protein OQA88_7720 [Cercophora sp. LCS_1]